MLRARWRQSTCPIAEVDDRAPRLLFVDAVAPHKTGRCVRQILLSAVSDRRLVARRFSISGFQHLRD